MKSNFLLTKLMLLLCLLVGSVNGAWADATDVLDLEFTGVSGTSYKAWSGKKADSGAVYAGQSAGGNSSIQLRSSGSNSGVVTTTSGGKVKSITVEWNSNTADGRTLIVYGNNSAYSEAADLYNPSKRGTPLGNIVNNGTSTSITVNGDYEYIGFRSSNNAIYLDKVTIEWASDDAPDTRAQTTVTIDATGITNTNVFTGTAAGSLSAIVKAGETAIGGASVTWESETESVATIASDGTVTLVGAGTTQITAFFDGDETYKPSTATYTLTVTNYDPNAPGTINNPYTVAEVINGTATGTGIYVKGFIVGCYKNNSFTNSDLDVNSNLALADDADETTNVIPVELPSGDRRDAFNVMDHPYNVGVAQILYKGNAKSYFGKNGVKGALVGTQKIAEKIDITAAGMATYYTDCALDFTGLTDMYVYIVTADGGSNYSLTRVNKVPAETGLLLYNPNGGVASNVVPVLTEAAEDVTGNALTGTLTEITAGANDYILNNGAEGVGFYKSNSNAIGMHRAYLTVAAGARPFFLINFDSEATGISFVGREASMNNRFFNLKGQQVKTPQKGLYIVNGKKVIVK